MFKRLSPSLQTPPPTLRDILTAYKTRGDGDRDMLLAMLNAKSAEDQRIASVASLQRTLLEVYQTSASHQPQPPSRLFYPSPYTHSSPPEERMQLPPAHHLHHHHQHHREHHRRDRRDSSASSRSPPQPPPMHTSQPPRKRHRPSSLTPPPSQHDSQMQGPDRLPPSPYSSSRSDSAEYSPRSRASMTINSLLSSGAARRDASADDMSVNSTQASSERPHQSQVVSATISV
ncbi:hypothetical protein HGRIS_007583 [Hohenbuehelia grisea]|uniref:Uncharacterized protein n=1 Tax=Hohenbuehelia grisea TaxID=104357 RepID=A0ABR3J5A2_9AGAR